MTMSPATRSSGDVADVLDVSESNNGLAKDGIAAADFALEIANEKSRTAAALKARDVVIHTLAGLFSSMHGQATKCDGFSSVGNTNNQEALNLVLSEAQTQQISKLKEEIQILEGRNKALVSELEAVKQEALAKVLIDVDETPRNPLSVTPPIANALTNFNSADGLIRESTPAEDAPSKDTAIQLDADPNDPYAMIAARHAFLAELLMPVEAPDETLKPILHSPSATNQLSIHEFLGIAACTPTLKSALSNHRILQQATTHWCPEREEHGYFLTPVFKCNTNPRVSTAHRWNSYEVMARLGKLIECFYSIEGKWYYAGTYKALRLQDLSTKEWDFLSTDTSSSIIKETLAARKNTSPQNTYEVSQLYAAGALKVACVALQCVGFNRDLYDGLLDQATRLRFRAASQQQQQQTPSLSGMAFGGSAFGNGVLLTPARSATSTPVLGPGATWNSKANVNVSMMGQVVDGLAGLSLNSPGTVKARNVEERDENSPVGSLGGKSV